MEMICTAGKAPGRLTVANEETLPEKKNKFLLLHYKIKTQLKYIFLADDDADDQMLFEDALKQVTFPTQLTISNDGLELMSNLEAVIESPPLDVIFLDLNMPRKNGFQCLEEIRNTPKLKDIPIVIFSTTASEDAVNKTYLNGANHYICKPRSFEYLVKTIETVLTLEMRHKPQPIKENFILTIV